MQRETKNRLTLFGIGVLGGAAGFIVFLATRQKKAILIVPSLLAFYVLMTNEPMFRGVVLTGWRRFAYGLSMLLVCVFLFLFA